MTSGVEAVVRLLESVGYQRSGAVVLVDSGTFRFDATLVRQDFSTDLVIVAAAQGRELRLLKRRIQALIWALQAAKARRVVTLALLSPQPSDVIHAEFAALCRTLVLDPNATSEEWRSRLRALLPLALPEPFGAHDRADAMIERELGGPDDSQRQLLEAARKSDTAVTRMFRDLLLYRLSTDEAGS